MIEVIVSKCSWNSEHRSYVAYGEVSRDTYRNLDYAQRIANSKVAKGVSVIVRPKYNERSENGKTFFREWRSFNREPFREVRFAGY